MGSIISIILINIAMVRTDIVPFITITIVVGIIN